MMPAFFGGWWWLESLCFFQCVREFVLWLGLIRRLLRSFLGWLGGGRLLRDCRLLLWKRLWPRRFTTESRERIAELDRRDFKEGELGLCDFKENEGNG